MTLNPQDHQLDLAARFLGSMMAMDRNRTFADRDDDIDHALDVAEELIRRRRARSPSAPPMTLELRPPIETRALKQGHPLSSSTDPIPGLTKKQRRPLESTPFA